MYIFGLYYLKGMLKRLGKLIQIYLENLENAWSFTSPVLWSACECITTKHAFILKKNAEINFPFPNATEGSARTILST